MLETATPEKALEPRNPRREDPSHVLQDGILLIP